MLNLITNDTYNQKLTSFHVTRDCLLGQTIMITGAGQGIGRECAIYFAAHGAHLIMTGSSEDHLMATKKLMGCRGREHQIYVLDQLSNKEDDYHQFFKRIKEENGKLNGILFNAAILGELSPIRQYSYNTWQETLYVNLTAPFLQTKCALMQEVLDGKASLVFTSSPVARDAGAKSGAYAVSKAGIETLTTVLWEELRYQTLINVNCIVPGIARTKLRSQAYPNESPQSVPVATRLMKGYLYLFHPDNKGFHGNIIRT